MDDNNRIVGDVTPLHFKNFLLAKGICGAKNNGAALEYIIDKAMPVILSDIQVNKKHPRG